MGYQLRRTLREELGVNVTGLQRAVALEIADDANERTGRSLASLEDLVRWTGAKNSKVVRNALSRLAEAGWEFRVPIGKGKDGRTLYTVSGRRMSFVVPTVEGLAAAVSSKGEETAGASSETAVAVSSPLEGLALDGSEAARAVSQGAVASPYSSYSSHLIPVEEPAEDADGRYPVDVLPLVHAMSASGLNVRWPFEGNQWFPLIATIKNSGVQTMVEHAHRAASVARSPVTSAKYFLAGWRELPPLPPEDTPVYRPTPHLRAVGQTPEERGIF